MWDPIKAVGDEWPVIQAAPILSAVLIAFGAVAAWWFRSRTAQAEIAGLKAQITAIKEQLAARDERRSLAEERLIDIQNKESALQTQVQDMGRKLKELDSQALRAGPSPELVAASASAGRAFQSIATSTEALSGSLEALRHGIASENAIDVAEIIRNMPPISRFPGNGV
jgi:hypothetical protein